MHSDAQTVDDYIEALPAERQETVRQVRQLILDNLPQGYEEGMGYGMIGYFVPLSTYPQGYLGDTTKPLPYIGLASQKNHIALYFMHIYGIPELARWFETEFKKSKKKMDMGKSCLRFKKLEDLPLSLIAQSVAKMTVPELITMYSSSRARKSRKQSS